MFRITCVDFSARSKVPKLTLSEINMLTWHNQKWILIIVIYFAPWLGKRHLTIYMVSCCYPLAFSRILYLQRCALYEQVTQDHCQLADPQVQRVGLGWGIRPLSVISKVIFSYSAAKFNKRSSVSFCYSNPVISTVTAPSSSTNHHHWSITTIPVTPEADLVAALDIATTRNLLKPVCCPVLSAILNRAASQAPVTGPNIAVSKVAITCDFGSKRLSTQTISFGFNKRYMVRVITTRDLELSACSQPKAWWNHISISWWIINCTHSSQTVIPPVTWVTHPVFVIAVREPSDQYPFWVTVPLPVRKIKLLSLSN